MQRLLNIGFQRVGCWIIKNGNLSFELDSSISSANALYTFISKDTVLYIGKTTRSLAKRMYDYQRPGPTQHTNIRNNAKLKELLAQTNLVDIYALPDHGMLQYSSFKINLAAGLEDSLIKTIKPIWNERL